MGLKKLIRKYPVRSYFLMTYTISWTGAILVVAPKITSGLLIPKMDGILMFPVMLMGPVVTGIVLNYVLSGKPGLRNLRFGIAKWRVPFKWYAICVLIPPCLVLLVLLSMQKFISVAYTPNFFLLGILFGIPAGFLEEIGWSGFAFPRLRLKYGFLKASVILGFLWGIWHLPVIDFLGAAYPHGSALPFFYFGFILILVGIRILMAWVYTATKSILLVQLLHIISTGSLVVLGPFQVTAGQEASWYLIYGATILTLLLVAYRLLFRFTKKPTAG